MTYRSRRKPFAQEASRGSTLLGDVATRGETVSRSERPSVASVASVRVTRHDPGLGAASPDCQSTAQGWWVWGSVCGGSPMAVPLVVFGINPSRSLQIQRDFKRSEISWGQKPQHSGVRSRKRLSLSGVYIKDRMLHIDVTLDQ